MLTVVFQLACQTNALSWISQFFWSQVVHVLPRAMWMYQSFNDTKSGKTWHTCTRPLSYKKSDWIDNARILVESVLSSSKWKSCILSLYFCSQDYTMKKLCFSTGRIPHTSLKTSDLSPEVQNCAENTTEVRARLRIWPMMLKFLKPWITDFTNFTWLFP